jgi:hypothetical protein
MISTMNKKKILTSTFLVALTMGSIESIYADDLSDVATRVTQVQNATDPALPSITEQK